LAVGQAGQGTPRAKTRVSHGAAVKAFGQRRS
jgi:hypothetical protein